MTTLVFRGLFVDMVIYPSMVFNIDLTVIVRGEMVDIRIPCTLDVNAKLRVVYGTSDYS